MASCAVKSNITWADVANKLGDSKPMVSKLNAKAPVFYPRANSAAFLNGNDPNVKSVDSVRAANGNILVNYHYVKCTNASSKDVKKYRGAIYETKADRFVCRSFGYVEEIDALKAVEQITNETLLNCNKYDLIEGFHIRVFQIAGVFYVSTHNKINAFESKWASEVSFGTLFIEALKHAFEGAPIHELSENGARPQIYNKIPSDSKLEYLCSQLDSQFVYDFVVSNNSENRIVCAAPQKPQIYLLGLFDVLNDFIYVEPPPHGVAGILPPTSLTVPDVQSLVNEVLKVDFMKSPGIVIINKKTGEIARIFHPNYIKCMRLRGETPNLELRYLEIRNNKDDRDHFHQIFPEYSSRFDELEMLITDHIPTVISQVYNIRYNKNVYYHTDRIFHFILRNLHSIGSENITRAQIDKELSLLSPVALYKLINSSSWTNVNE